MCFLRGSSTDATLLHTPSHPHFPGLERDPARRAPGRTRPCRRYRRWVLDDLERETAEACTTGRSDPPCRVESGQWGIRSRNGSSSQPFVPEPVLSSVEVPRSVDQGRKPVGLRASHARVPDAMGRVGGVAREVPRAAAVRPVGLPRWDGDPARTRRVEGLRSEPVVPHGLAYALDGLETPSALGFLSLRRSRTLAESAIPSPKPRKPSDQHDERAVLRVSFNHAAPATTAKVGDTHGTQTQG
jgi:hypothetical protein